MANERPHPILRDLRGGFVGIAIEVATIAFLLAVAGVISLLVRLLF